MTNNNAAASNDKWSTMQTGELQRLAAQPGFTFDKDVCAKLTKDALFSGKSERMIIGKVKSLGLPYATQGTKSPTAAAAKDETAADVQKDIIALLGLSDDVKLLQKTGLVKMREKIRALIAVASEADEIEPDEVAA